MRLVSLAALQIIALVVLQVAATAVLWFLNPLTQAATDTFALYLSVDLLSFTLISYIYRTSKSGAVPSQTWMAAGYLSLIILLTSNLLLQ